MSPTQQPNLLLIMSDEHGAMFSSAYGHPLVRTPNMDRLAETGATFDAGYCNAPLCVPAAICGWAAGRTLPSTLTSYPSLSTRSRTMKHYRLDSKWQGLSRVVQACILSWTLAPLGSHSLDLPILALQKVRP